jgi:hypothetical protein
MSQKIWLHQWAGVLVISVAVGCWGCRSDHGTPPDYLIGVWRTSASQYAGSTMEFMKDSIVFKGETGSSVSGRIIRFEQIQEGSTTFYRLSYRDKEKNDYQLSFTYEPAQGGTVRFKNQPQLVWTRTGAST